MADIAFERVGKAGLIALQRPKALNALSQAMVGAMHEALDEWARDDAVERVVVRGEGKAFCAGGDIRDIYARRSGAVDFFTAEYRLNHRVGTFPKPYVSLIDGIVMGGGVGISLHGSHRIGTENLVFAMPEVGIGLFPDVGAAHHLSRMPGRVGRYVGLTGARFGRDAASAIGVVTHPMRSDRLDAALDRVAHARSIDALDELTEPTEPRDADEAALIDHAFDAGTVSGVLERLDDDGGAFAAKTAASMREKSPTSLEVSIRAIDRAADGDLTQCLRTDFRILSRTLDGHDFYEGIRATVIDKDKAPKWSPATLAGIDPEEIETYFVRPAHGDLEFAGD